MVRRLELRDNQCTHCGRELCMAGRIEITCVVRSALFGADERILSIGGMNFAGRPWRMSQEGAVRGIEDGKYFFYIHRGGKVINVIVASSSRGYKYLNTFTDTDHPNMLLLLPECPRLP
jgi:hypothetical protein